MSRSRAGLLARVSLRPVDVPVLVSCGLVLVLSTADVVAGGLLTHLDGQVRDAVQPRSPATPAWMDAVGALGDLGVAAAVLAITGLVVAHARWRLWPLVLAAGNFVVIEAVVYVVKLAVGRPGPGELADSTGYPGYFPSGHTAAAVVSAATAIFLVLVLRWGDAQLDRAETVALAGGAVVGLVTAIRAVLGDFHWASDGLAGLAVAMIVLIVGFGLARGHVQSPATKPVRPSNRR